MTTKGTFTFELRRGRASEWTEENPILHPGEPGFEVDTGKMKIGNGIDDWAHLGYYPPTALSVAGVASVDGRTGVVTLGDIYAALVHAHELVDVTGLVTALAGKASTSHSHVEGDVTGLTSDLAGKAATSHAHAESDVTGLSTDLNALSTSIAGKASSSHTHIEGDVTGLTSDLAGKAASVHNHAGTDINSGTVAIARLPTGTSGSTVALGNHGHHRVVVSLVDGATISLDASAGDYFRLTLGGDHTLSNPTGMYDGQPILIEVTQGSGGNHLLTLGSAFIFSADLASFTLSTAAGKVDLIGCVYNSSLGKWLVMAFIAGF